MTHNIHKMLSAYNFNALHKNSFIRILNSLKNDINALDAQGNTPILHYCIQQLKSNKQISHKLLHILITQYHADVNIRNHDNMIPLNTIMSLAWTSDKINLIALLIQYTTLQSLLFNQGKEQSLFQSIIFSSVLWGTGIAKNVLDHMTNKNLHRDFDHTLWQQCKDVLLASYTIPNILYILDKLYNYANPHFNAHLHFDALLQQAIRANNPILVSALLKYSTNINQDNILAYIQGHEKIKNKILKDWHKDNNNIIDNIIICDQLINIPDLIPPSRYSNINTQMRNIIKSGLAILQSYMKYHDKTILEDFGFNNNYFHFTALTSQKRCLNTVALQSRYELTNTLHDAINAVNDFGQTPLEIALLCHNKSFISYYSKLVNKNNMNLWDTNGDTIMHIMARVHLKDADEIQLIFQELSLNIGNIIAQTNMLGRNPAYNAVLLGNNIFLQWWIDNGGISHLSDIDHTHQTLWHALVHASIAMYSEEDIILKNMEFEKQRSAQVLEIYKILKSYIPQQIDQPDASQMTPTHLAIALGRCKILRLFLQDFDEIDLQTTDQIGNTIAHTMANNFIFEPQNIAWNIEIVQILKPYKNQINSIYRIKNLYHERSIDILQENLGNVLQSIISDALCEELLEIVGGYECYDNIIVFSPQFSNILEKITIQDISSNILDTIRALSFEIAYSTVNDWGDTIIHTLISNDLVIFSSDIIVVLILEIIGREMADVVYNVPNKLGQCILHLAIYKGHVNIVQKVLTYNIAMINQPTKALQLNLVALFERPLHQMQVTLPHDIISTWFVGFYPADYAMISNHADAALQVLCDKFTAAQQENLLLVGDMLDSKYPNDIAQRFSQLYEKYFRKIDIPSSQSNVHDILTSHKYKQLIAIRDNNIRIMMKDFSTLPNTLESLSLHLNFIYPVRIADDLAKLEQILWNLLKFQNTDKIILIAITHGSHVSALVLLFDAISKQYYAYLQDSMYQGGATMNNSAYYERYIAITKTLCDNLHVAKANIYELPITQQKYTESTCGLWTMANLKIMEQSILQKSKTLWCCPVIGISKQEIYRTMIHDIKMYAPALEQRLEELIWKVHTKAYDPIKWVLPFNAVTSNLAIKEKIEHMEYDKDGVSSYHTIQLSDHNIRTIVHEHYPEMFDVHALNAHYNHSNHGLVVVKDPLLVDRDGKSELIVQIDEFINTYNNQQERSTRTFIINQGSNHWVTFVITQKHNNIMSYFVDSYALPMPLQIKSIINKILSGMLIIENLSIRQQNDHYNCGLWAIENARDINTMLSKNYDLTWLNAQMDPARLGRNDNQYFINMRMQFRAELESDVPTQEANIRLRTFEPSCDSKTQSTLDRRKLCNEDIENSKIEYSLLESNNALDIQVREQLDTIVKDIELYEFI